MFGPLGFWEILLIFVVLLLLSGSCRLADSGRGLGEGVANFIKDVRSIKEESHPKPESPPKQDQRD